MLLGTFGATLLGNLLTGKGVKRSNIPRQRVMQSGEGTVQPGEGPIRAGQKFQCRLIL